MLLTTAVVAAVAAPAPVDTRLPGSSGLAVPAADSAPTPVAARRATKGATSAPHQATATAPAVAAPRTTVDVDRLQAALDAWTATRTGLRSVAVGVALAEPGAPWWGGVSTAPGHAALDLGEQHGVLSVTKTFTEALVLREVAAGRIDLDAPVPNVAGVATPPADVVITPRMLLQHSSGLVNYPNAIGYDPNAPITPQQIVSSALRTPLLSPPGTKAAYSNTNFHWLGLVLEHVTGSSYGELVAALAAEVGLADTVLDPAGRPGWIGYASGGIRSTIGDMARWGAALFTPGGVLPADQLDALTTVGPLGVSLGLWPVAGNGLSQFVAHGGLVYYPDERLVVVVRISGTGDAVAAARDLAGVLRAAVGTL
ncbi:MAG TPA: serine hydrolase domain-containing protein [Acidimicrobiales bacterium]|nr:serine hydrolase domain-containing protein [Acidimicrobiales bacterium]